MKVTRQCTANQMFYAFIVYYKEILPVSQH